MSIGPRGQTPCSSFTDIFGVAPCDDLPKMAKNNKNIFIRGKRQEGQRHKEADMTKAAPPTDAPVPDQNGSSQTPPVSAKKAKPAKAPKHAKPRKRKRTKIFEAGVGVAGFGKVLDAWRAEGNRFKNVAASLVKKFADMAAGSIVSMSFRLIAITWVAGIIGGVSTFGALGLLAAATGAASGVYNYSKAYIGDKLKLPKDQRHTVKLFDRARARRAAVAFGTGFLSGGLGLWLAKTEIVQSLLTGIHNFFKPATDVIKTPFNEVAAKPAPLAAAPIAAPIAGAGGLAALAPLSESFAQSLAADNNHATPSRLMPRAAQVRLAA